MKLLAFSSIVVAVAIAYFLTIYLPAKEKREFDLKREQIKSQQETDQAWRLYQEGKEIDRQTATSECNQMFRQGVADGSIDGAGLNNINDARVFVDAWMENCMRYRGYND